VPAEAPAQRVFSERELMQYNGEKGRPVYIAYKGIVYDVSASRRWRTGLHEGVHYAGLELTRSFPEAPHGEEVFARWPVVGRVVQSDW
jgi:predicted heme/steroid binding protein